MRPIGTDGLGRFRSAAAVLAAVTALAATAVGQEAPTPPVLFADGFEAAGAPGPHWKAVDAGELIAAVAADTENPAEGSRSLRRQVEVWHGGEARLVREPVVLRAGATYTLTLALRGEGRAAPLRVILRRPGAEGATLAEERFHCPREWRRRALALRAAPEGPVEAVLALESAGRVWVDDVRLTEGEVALPDDPEPTGPDETGNRVYNGSFEVGVEGWATSGQATRVRGEAPDGDHFLRRLPSPDPLECRPFRIRPARTLTVAFHARCRRPEAHVRAVLLELGGGYRAERRFAVGAEWTRLQLPAQPPARRSAYCLVQVFADPAEMDLDLDAFVVREGADDGYAPRGPVELALALPGLAAFPPANGLVEAAARVYAPGGTVPGMALVARVIDRDGRTTVSRTVALAPDNTRAEVLLALRAPGWGVHRLEVSVTRDGKPLATETRALTVLGAPRDLPVDDCFLGGHGRADPQAGSRTARIAERAGFRWWRTHSPAAFTAWSVVEPRPGERVWYHRELDALRGTRLALLGVLGRTPIWAAREPESEAARLGAAPPAREADLERYAARVAAAYAGRLQAFELWASPASPLSWRGTPEEYAAAVAIATRGVRAVDPAAKIVAGGYNPARPQFADGALRAGLARTASAISMELTVPPSRLYGRAPGTDDVVQAVNDLRRRVAAAGTLQRPLWITSAAVEQSGGDPWDPEGSAIAAGRALTRLAILARSRGVERLFVRTVRAETGRERLYSASFEPSAALVRGLGDGGPGLAGLASCARFLDGTRTAGNVETEALRCYVFAATEAVIVSLWSPVALREPRIFQIGLPPLGTQAFTWYGDRIRMRYLPDAVLLPLGVDPVFLVVRRQNAKGVLESLRAAARAARSETPMPGGAAARRPTSPGSGSRPG